MTDYENMSDEELKEHYEKLKRDETIANAKKLEEAKIARENAAKQEELDKKVQEHFESNKDEILKGYFEEHPEAKPDDGLDVDPDSEPVNTQSDNKFEVFYNGYYERNQKVKSATGKLYDNTKQVDTSLQIANGKSGMVSWNTLFSNTDSDSGCEDDVSAWSPADVYSRIIWNTFVCKADLFRICVKGLAINPGEGLSTQIRVYGALSDPTERASCECLSCASITFTTHTLTLKQYGKEVIVCEKDIWDVGNILMDSYLNALSDMWAAWFDKQIYDELETASPGTTETLPAALACDPALTGSCCTDASLLNMYNAVQSAVASMREGTAPYNPDYIIMSPTVASIFKRMQTPTRTLGYDDVSFDANGRLKTIAGLEVIEYCRANSCATTSAEVMAVIIDSRRAVGAVFGQQPKTYKFFQTNCNSTRIDSWAFFAVGELDTSAIAHIVNP